MDKILIFFTGLFCFILSIILISDGLTYFHLEKTIVQLQNLQKQIEKNLLPSTEKESPLTTPTLLHSNEVSFHLANLCHNANLPLEKLQLLKPKSKTPDEFELALTLQGTYKNFMVLVDSVQKLPWNIHWKILKISQQKDQNDDLDIKIKLAISVYYFIQPSSQKNVFTNQHQQTIPLSPFTISRHVGKINNTELITVGRKIFCTSQGV